MKGVVAIDARMLRHSGIGTYLCHLLQGLVKQAEDNFGPRFRFYGQPSVLAECLPNLSPESFVRFESPIYSLREHWDHASLSKRWDVWHSPHYNVPFFKKGKLVVTVHDLTHIVLGEYFSPVARLYAKTTFSRVKKDADAVIAVSQHTKGDLAAFVGLDPERVRVIHEGVSQEFRPLGDAAMGVLRKKYGLEGKFLLYVGNIKRHKNVGQLIRVFRELRSRKKIEESLVLVGRLDQKLAAKDKDIQKALGDPDIRFLSPVPSQDLPGIYNLADALVLPSLYEGFGLVVLEAMACGTPAILSNRGSLPEIAGDAAEFFDPSDDGELAWALQRVLLDEKRREVLRALGQRRASLFSWEKMASETLEVYGGIV